MKKVFIVRLTETERLELDALARKGKGIGAYHGACSDSA